MSLSLFLIEVAETNFHAGRKKKLLAGADFRPENKKSAPRVTEGGFLCFQRIKNEMPSFLQNAKLLPLLGSHIFDSVKIFPKSEPVIPGKT